MTSRTFGKRVRDRRIEAGLSQEELAGRVEISRNYLSQIERDEATNLSWRVVESLTAELGLKAEQDEDADLELAGLPPGLAEFTREAKLTDEDVAMLARLQYRGKQPSTADQWRLVYLAIKTATEASRGSHKRES